MTAAWEKQRILAGCWRRAAQRDEEECTPAELSSVHQENLLPGYPKKLEMPPQATDLTQSCICPSTQGWFGDRCSALELWMGTRIWLGCLRTRKFGQQKAEGGGVLLNGFLSVETPWNYNKRPEPQCLEVGMKPHLALPLSTLDALPNSYFSVQRWCPACWAGPRGSQQDPTGAESTRSASTLGHSAPASCSDTKLLWGDFAVCTIKCWQGTASNGQL